MQYVMMNNLPGYLYWIAAVVLLFIGVYVLRFILKFAWKIIRVILIVLGMILVAGYAFGFLEFALH
jgi:hypothetical protein